MEFGFEVALVEFDDELNEEIAFERTGSFGTLLRPQDLAAIV